MSRHRRGGWGAAGMWPFMMYGQQPGGWSEQTMGMGFGQRPGRGNGLCSPRPNDSSNCDQSLSLESLSSLFTRLILQNHLTRLAGDTLGLGGRGLWGYSVPASSCAHQDVCSPPFPNCQKHSHPHGQQSSGCGGVSLCGHPNSINMCHTCPAATRPYMGANNVFVIPAAPIQQQPSGGPAPFGTFNNLHLNNLNMFLSELGVAMGSNNGCGGDPVGGGFGGPAVNSGNGGYNFSCGGCNFQL